MAGLREWQSRNIRLKWFTLNSGQTAKVLFLRELEDALWVVEHNNPKNWQKRAFCTADSGFCYGCEQAKMEAFSGWSQKPKLYIDAWIDDGYEEYVGIVSQTLTASAITPKLIEYSRKNGTIMDRYFEICKTGKGKKTKQLLLPAELGTSKARTLNLEKSINRLDYNEQPKYYNY